MLNLRITDANYGELMGHSVGTIRVAVVDLSESGEDHTEAMRKRALRATGGTASRVVRRWAWYGAPAVSVLVLNPDHFPEMNR